MIVMYKSVYIYIKAIRNYGCNRRKNYIYLNKGDEGFEKL